MSVDLTRGTAVVDSFALAGGPRVLLRPARAADLESLRGLALKAGLICDELELARLVRSDPATRLVLSATTATTAAGTAERVIGVGVIELGRSFTMPSLVLVDADLPDGLRPIIVDALVEQARALAGPRVA